MNLLFKIAGIILLIAGFILTIKPNWVSPIPESVTSYEMIEKRVLWRTLIGLGLLAIFNHQIYSWKTGIFALLSALTLGIIVARLIGLFMDGFYVKQLLWLGIELLFLVIFVILYRTLK